MWERRPTSPEQLQTEVAGNFAAEPQASDSLNANTNHHSVTIRQGELPPDFRLVFTIQNSAANNCPRWFPPSSTSRSSRSVRHIPTSPYTLDQPWGPATHPRTGIETDLEIRTEMLTEVSNRNRSLRQTPERSLQVRRPSMAQA